MGLLRRVQVKRLWPVEDVTELLRLADHYHEAWKSARKMQEQQGNPWGNRAFHGKKRFACGQQPQGMIRPVPVARCPLGQSLVRLVEDFPRPCGQTSRRQATSRSGRRCRVYPRAPRRKLFVSYHHDRDQEYYDHFSSVFCGSFELATDRSLARRIGSESAEYVMRRIREDYLTGSSVTVVLCGEQTPWRKYVDWEICASLNQQMGLVGINLPTNPVRTDGTCIVPDRLRDNIVSGYAVWASWNGMAAEPRRLQALLEKALGASKTLIDNSRPTRQRNG
jgi:MTH538 TIR-like domain (DUF1863)